MNFQLEAAYILGMKVNSDKQLDLGRKVLREHGSWGAVKRASYVREDGITVVRRNAATGAFTPSTARKSVNQTPSSKK